MSLLHLLYFLDSYLSFVSLLRPPLASIRNKNAFSLTGTFQHRNPLLRLHRPFVHIFYLHIHFFFIFYFVTPCTSLQSHLSLLCAYHGSLGESRRLEIQIVPCERTQESLLELNLKLLRQSVLWNERKV